jgi:hypothetical protein
VRESKAESKMRCHGRLQRRQLPSFARTAKP